MLLCVASIEGLGKLNLLTSRNFNSCELLLLLVVLKHSKFRISNNVHCVSYLYILFNVFNCTSFQWYFLSKVINLVFPVLLFSCSNVIDIQLNLINYIFLRVNVLLIMEDISCLKLYHIFNFFYASRLIDSNNGLILKW